MKTVYRGMLAVVGVVSAFFTLVFLSQTSRYLNLALLGDELSLGMFGVYVILLFVGVTVTALCFRPEYSTATYLGGAGIGLGGLLFLVAVYLFTTDLSSGMMLLIFAIVQASIAAVIIAVSRSKRDDGEKVSSTDT